MILSEIIRELERFAPPAFQEEYDNSGLQCGLPDQEIQSALLCLDVNEKVIEEALETGVHLIISHHPVIFKPLHRLTDQTEAERIIRKAVEHGLAIYSIHTNVDKVQGGVSFELARKLGLEKIRILEPERGKLLKLITFVPSAHLEEVKAALFGVGAGTIGAYDHCSFSSSGTGSFRAGDQTNPYVGERGKDHLEQEERLEVILPAWLRKQVVAALLNAHPYEEVAYDLYRLDNADPQLGSGAIGSLPECMPVPAFLEMLAQNLGAKGLRYTNFAGPVKRVAVCGGSGASLLSAALRNKAEAFITADIKYHQFFDSSDRLLLVDAGHFETEQFIKEVFYHLLTEKFPNFAVRFSTINTNPINYY